MNIRSKLTFRFTLIVAAIILFLFIAIYYFSSSYRQSEFYGRLKNRGINTAKLLVDVTEVDSTLLRIIDQNTRNALLNEDIIIYDFNNRSIYDNYNDADPVAFSSHLVNRIKDNQEIKFQTGGKENIGFVYNGKFGNFIVIVTAYDTFGISKLRNLRLILIVGFLFSITVTIIAGWLFATQALHPVARITSEADQINATNLKARINEGNRKDELAKLAITFNNMLNRIEKSFELQRSFVSNSSHELRTPLTAIRGQIEVSLLKERNNAEYKEILISVLDDITNLISLTNNLLDIANASTDETLHKPVKTRIDEQLFTAREELIARNPNYKVNIVISSFPTEEKKLSLLGSEQLLKCAFLNIMENGCKYSQQNSVDVLFHADDETINLDFTDNGIGIPPGELENVTQPFYRASNVPQKTGHGLGLALTTKIIQLHKGQFKIYSKLNKGTTVRISLPTLV